jgi:hypothetical protein
MYAPAAALAREMGKLSPLLTSFKPTAPPSQVVGDARVGSFVDAGGHAVLVVASTRPDAPVTARVSVDATAAWKDRLTGEVLVPTNGALMVPLAPGAGRVLVRR